MKKLFSFLLTLLLVLTASAAMAKGSEDPHKGDVGGEIAAKIDAAIRSGKDPSVYVNVPVTPPDPPYYPPPYSGSTSGITFIFYDAPTGVTESVYALFRSHALKWYNNSFSLQQQFGNFTAYFTYAYNAEQNNFYKFGHNFKMSLDTYLKSVIYQNKMPYAA